MIRNGLLAGLGAMTPQGAQSAISQLLPKALAPLLRFYDYVPQAQYYVAKGAYFGERGFDTADDHVGDLYTDLINDRDAWTIHPTIYEKLVDLRHRWAEVRRDPHFVEIMQLAPPEAQIKAMFGAIITDNYFWYTRGPEETMEFVMQWNRVTMSPPSVVRKHLERDALPEEALLAGQTKPWNDAVRVQGGGQQDLQTAIIQALERDPDLLDDLEEISNELGVPIYPRLILVKHEDSGPVHFEGRLAFSTVPSAQLDLEQLGLFDLVSVQFYLLAPSLQPVLRRIRPTLIQGEPIVQTTATELDWDGRVADWLQPVEQAWIAWQAAGEPAAQAVQPGESLEQSL